MDTCLPRGNAQRDPNTGGGLQKNKRIPKTDSTWYPTWNPETTGLGKVV